MVAEYGSPSSPGSNVWLTTSASDSNAAEALGGDALLGLRRDRPGLRFAATAAFRRAALLSMKDEVAADS